MPEKNFMQPAIGLTVTFKNVGPLKRSTLERDHPDPEWERLSDAEWWSFCTRLQAKRLIDSLRAEFPVGQRPYWKARKLFAATSFDLHSFLVAGRNLERSIHRLRKHDLEGFRPPTGTWRALHLLRDIHEHWDALRSGFRHGILKRAAQELALEYPEAEPWSLSIEPDGDLRIANTVSLRTLYRDLRSFEARIWWRLRILRRLGRSTATKVPPNQTSAPDGFAAG